MNRRDAETLRFYRDERDERDEGDMIRTAIIKNSFSSPLSLTSLLVLSLRLGGENA